MSTSEVFRVFKPFHWFDHLIANNHKTSHSIMTSICSWCGIVFECAPDCSLNRILTTRQRQLFIRSKSNGALSLPLDIEELMCWITQPIKQDAFRLFLNRQRILVAKFRLAKSYLFGGLNLELFAVFFFPF